MKIKKYNSFINEDINLSNIEGICQNFLLGNYEYTINKDGLVDVYGDVDLGEWSNKLEKLPIRFGRVTGHFICSRNSLKSLDGAPNFVGGDFNCSYNELNDLVGGPEHVDGLYKATYNEIVNFNGFPKYCGLFYVSSNPVYELYKLFKDFSNCNTSLSMIPLFLDYDILQDGVVILDRLNDFLEEIGKLVKPITSVDGYKCI